MSVQSRGKTIVGVGGGPGVIVGVVVGTGAGVVVAGVVVVYVGTGGGSYAWEHETTDSNNSVATHISNFFIVGLLMAKCV